MRIWIDGQCLQTPSRTRGIGRYVTNFIRSLAKLPEVELIISFNAGMPYQAISARAVVGKWVEPRNIHIWSGIAEGGEVQFGYTDQRKLSELALCWHVETLQPDIALSVSPFEGTWNAAVPLLPNSLLNRPIVSIFYDAIPHHFPNHYLRTKEERRAYERRFAAYNHFSYNLCISEFSANDAKRLFPNVRATNISTGVDPDLLKHLSGNNAENQFSQYNPFVLYVGALDWRKNVRVVIDSFALLPDGIRSQTKFVMAGEQPPELLDPLVNQWKTHALPGGNLVTLEHIDDSKLFELYRAARVLVQPSFMEGFGLTAVEAMLAGTPVLGSRGSALSEVIGEDEYQFEPSDPQELANKIERVLTDEAFAERASEQNLVRAKEFSWERTAGRTLDALRKIDVRPTPLSQDLQSRRDMYGKAASNFALEPIEIAKAFANAEVRQFSEERLFVDATSTLLRDHGTGIQRVVKEICSSLSNRPAVGDQNFIMFSDSKRTWQHAKSSEVTKKISREGALRANINFNPSDHVLMLDSSWDLHETHIESLLSLRLLGCNVTTCLYDTVPLKHPAMCDKNMPPVFTEWLKSALLWSTGFVCISRAVADELLGILEAIEFPRRMKIGYWHLGANFSDSVKISASARQPGRNRSYLMVGTLEPRKGHTVAIDAFERLWLDGGDEELVIVGKPGWNTKELSNRILNHPEHGRRLHWHRNVDDEKLAELYSNADALLATSYAEGFGLPIVEARHFGKPIVASDIPVFREVTEGATCRFFEVGSSAALADVLVEIRLGFKQNELANSTPSDWINWDQSAALLRNVVIGDNWYKIYEPKNSNPFVALNDLGNISMSKPLGLEERQHRLEYVSGPTLDETRDQLLFAVKLENRSHVPWSSRGPMALYIGCRLLNERGLDLRYDNPHTRIPFVHIPGDDQYIAVEVPTDWRERGATHVDVGIVQESVGWWDNTLHIPLT